MGLLLHIAVFACLMVATVYADDYYCPLWACDRHKNYAGYEECLQDIPSRTSCVVKTLRQSDICEKCKKDNFHGYEPVELGKNQRFRCHIDGCNMGTLYRCADFSRWMFFYDTSSVDDTIECVKNWRPVNGQRRCLRELDGLDIPQSVDTAELIATVFREIRDGCDIMVPLSKCRHHLKPAIFNWESNIRLPTAGEIRQALNETAKCLQNIAGQYKCPTLQSYIPHMVKAAVFQLERHYTHYRVGDPVQYTSTCGSKGLK